MSAGELVTRCFAARTAAHIAHLRTRSYSVHMALQEFYESIVDLADKFAEVYQGTKGAIDEWPHTPPPKPSADLVQVITDLRDWLVEYRSACSKGSTALQNIVDEITGQCSHTLYKLTTLR